jgi:protein translocase SecG subunit
MNIIESIWFAIAITLIAIVLVIDPKASVSSTSLSPVSGFFSSPSSSQSFIYRFSALLIILFYVLTILLSYN